MSIKLNNNNNTVIKYDKTTDNHLIGDELIDIFQMNKKTENQKNTTIYLGDV